MTIEALGARFAESLAAELKGQLAYAKMPAATLAPLIAHRPVAISQWLNGKRAIPFRFVYSACQVVGIRVPELLQLTEKRMRQETPLLMTGALSRRDPTRLTPDDLFERGDLFADCIAAELKAQLAAHSLSVWQIGQETGHSRTASGQWLTGQRAIPVAFTYSACEVVGIPIADLAERAELRMGAFVDDEVQPTGAPSTAAPGLDHPSLSTDIIGRRLRALLGLRRQDPENAYSLVSAAVSRSGGWLDHESWISAVDGRGGIDASTLLVIAESLGQTAAFFTDPDPEVTDRIEAEATLAEAAAEAGVKRIAARGELTPEGLRKIAALVDKYVPKK